MRRTSVGCALLALALLGVSVLVPVPAGASARAARTRASIRLLSQPVLVAPDGAFVVALSIKNAPAGGALAVDIYDRVTNPSDLAKATDRDPTATFFPVVPLAVDPTSDQTAFFAIQLYPGGAERPPGPWTYRITKPGVYPIRVRLRDASADDIGTFTTTLIRAPEAGQEVGRADVALLPVVHRDPPKDPAARAGNVLVTGSLASELAPFVEVFAGHPSVPATFAVTPDTAARLDGDATTAGVARDLRRVVAGNDRQLLDAPYVDVDPAQLAATGQDDELTALRDLGRTTLTDHVGNPSPGTWLLPRPIDPAALGTLRQDGIDRFIVSPRALRGPPPRRAVTVAAGDGPVSIIVAQTGLVDGLAQATDSVRAAHQLLARLTLLAADQPGLRLVLPLDPSVSADTLGVLLDSLAFGTPSYRAVPLDDVFADPEPLSAGSALSPPAPAPPPDYQKAVDEVSADLASYRSMTAASSTSTVQDDRAFTRGLAFSAAVDLSSDQRVAELRAVQARAQARFAGISIRPRDKVTLGSRRARFPLPVTSKLTTPVNVLVELDANDRLDFPDERISVTLRGDRTVVQIPVRTRTSGDTPVLITIRSPDGRVILSEGRYTIRSTAVSGSGLILTIGAGAFLALWWGRHWLRDRRQSGPRRART